jgi:peptidyl-prolyl cis-trans isomerase SurA
MHKGAANGCLAGAEPMTLRLFLAPAAFGTLLAVATFPAQAQNNVPASPYGGSVVEDIIARVNDQIITQSDYDRALSEMDQESRQHGDTMQQMSAAHKDLLRSLIDQQLWLSKGKELGIDGKTELVRRLDEIRKQYNLASLDDLKKAAEEQGVSYEDFEANIRNGIITQEVMRQEVGEHIQFTPGEAMRYYDAHKQDYTQPESERLSEILIAANSDDAAKQAAAKAKADDIEARLHAGGDFAQLARSFSEGPTASEGGDLGQYKRGQLSKALEDKTFSLSTGQYTDPILTRQGYIILKVVQHNAGGPAAYKDVEQQVEESLYESRMEPAIRAYLNKMRDEAAIFIKPGYVDTGATYSELHPTISFSAYVPPAAKKKAKVERTRFRESTHTFRQKSQGEPPEQAAAPAQPASANAKKSNSDKNVAQATEKPGKKEKIRFGQAPRETLPSAANNSTTENAGALPETADNSQQPENPLEPTRSAEKSRFSDRARTAKKNKSRAGSQTDADAPAPPDAAEVADQETQSAPLGLGSNASAKKKASTTSEKTRLANKKKSPSDSNATPTQQPTPIAPVPGAPAPADAPKPQQ